MLLTDIMNHLFLKDQFDANFISVYNKELEQFDYYVERLMGVDIKNEKNPLLGEMWHPYINGTKEDWSVLCHKNRLVHKEDEIIWKYEFNAESQS